MGKTICIIGGGVSGLTAIKACLEQNLTPVCYEWTKHVGGLWRYREDDVHGSGSVMRSTIINSSKEASAFSDYPPPTEFPNYMHHSKMIKYIEMYAKEFDLVKYVNFEHKVERVVPADDFDETGRWRIKVKRVSGEEFEETFDGVMVCAGHHVFPIIPEFPGQDEFKGRIIHTHSYKKPNGYDNKKVVVVGIGNSGGDVAVELSSIASQVYLSTRRGAWIVHRVGHRGKPFDSFLMRRFVNLFFNNLPYSVTCSVAEGYINNRVDHELYDLKPDHRILGQHPMVNDALPNRILSGTVQVKGDIKQFTAKGIIFEGEDEEIPVDEVVLATGYKIYFPYLSKDIVWVEDNKVELFQNAFPPKLKHKSLVLIGLAQPLGPLIPISELQSRVYALHICGKIKLPSEEEMLEDIKRKEIERQKRYFSGPRHTIQTDWINYMDELASLAGVKPNLFSMFFDDPLLFYQCFVGPCFPYQYRLTGPNSWKGARNALMTADDRIAGALKTRHSQKKMQHQTEILKYMMAMICITLLIMVLAMTLL